MLVKLMNRHFCASVSSHRYTRHTACASEIISLLTDLDITNYTYMHGRIKNRTIGTRKLGGLSGLVMIKNWRITVTEIIRWPLQGHHFIQTWPIDKRTHDCWNCFDFHDKPHLSTMLMVSNKVNRKRINHLFGRESVTFDVRRSQADHVQMIQ